MIKPPLKNVLLKAAESYKWRCCMLSFDTRICQNLPSHLNHCRWPAVRRRLYLPSI